MIGTHPDPKQVKANKTKLWHPRKPLAASSTLKFVEWHGPRMARLPEDKRQWSKYRFATRLRRHPTRAEEHLKRHLKRQYGNKNVWFQPVIYGYIPDFYFPSIKLAVEVDGGIHNTEAAKHYDSKREFHLNRCGIHIIRFTNRQCLDTASAVIQQLNRTIKELGGKFLRDAFITNQRSDPYSRKRDTRGELKGKPSAQGSGVAG